MKKLLGIVVLGLLWCNVGFAEWKSTEKYEWISTAKHKDGNEFFKTLSYPIKSVAESIALAKCRTSELGKKNPSGCYIVKSECISSSGIRYANKYCFKE